MKLTAVTTCRITNLRRVAGLVVAAATLTAAACGGDDGNDQASTSPPKVTAPSGSPISASSSDATAAATAGPSTSANGPTTTAAATPTTTTTTAATTPTAAAAPSTLRAAAAATAAVALGVSGDVLGEDGATYQVKAVLQPGGALAGTLSLAPAGDYPTPFSVSVTGSSYPRAEVGLVAAALRGLIVPGSLPDAAATSTAKGRTFDADGTHYVTGVDGSTIVTIVAPGTTLILTRQA